MTAISDALVRFFSQPEVVGAFTTLILAAVGFAVRYLEKRKVELRAFRAGEERRERVRRGEQVDDTRKFIRDYGNGRIRPSVPPEE